MEFSQILPLVTWTECIFRPSISEPNKNSKTAEREVPTIRWHYDGFFFKSFLKN